MKEQFLRTEIMLGENVLRQLQNNFAVIVGLGAVGSFATEALARLGMKKFRLVDFDTVCPTNINRQLYALHSTIGQKKHLLAKNRVLDINPDANVQNLDLFADTETFSEIFESYDDSTPDIVIDAIDSLSPKAKLLAECVQRKIPVFSSMGAATRSNPSLIRVADISKTYACPLAAQVRRRLKKLHVSKGITCVFSTEPPNRDALRPVQDFDDTIAHKRPNTLGSLPTMTGIMGLTLAHAAMEFLIKQAKV